MELYHLHSSSIKRLLLSSIRQTFYSTLKLVSLFSQSNIEMGDTVPDSSKSSSSVEKFADVDFKGIVDILCNYKDLSRHFFKLYSSLKIRHPQQNIWGKDIENGKSGKVFSAIILTWVFTHGRKAKISTLVNALKQNGFENIAELITEKYNPNAVVIFVSREGQTRLYESFYNNFSLTNEVIGILVTDSVLDAGQLNMALENDDKTYKSLRYNYMLESITLKQMLGSILQNWIARLEKVNPATPALLCSILEKENFRMLRDTIMEKLDAERTEDET